MLTLTFLGVGAAFAKRNFQSNVLIEAWTTGPDRQDAPDDTLLIDFGATGPLALDGLRRTDGFTYLSRNDAIYYPNLRNVLVTHVHGDHVAGLEELAVMNIHKYVDPATGEGFKARLISSDAILTDLWEKTLCGALGVLDGRRVGVGDYFERIALSPDAGGKGEAVALLDRYDVSLFPTDHIRLQIKHDWPSVGVLLADQVTGGTVVFSGDCRFDPDAMAGLMAAAKLVFHEVQLEHDDEPVHTLLSQLRTLPAEVREKIILYHYGDAWDGGAYAFVADEFEGFALPHHRYTLFA